MRMQIAYIFDDATQSGEMFLVPTKYSEEQVESIFTEANNQFDSIFDTDALEWLKGHRCIIAPIEMEISI